MDYIGTYDGMEVYKVKKGQSVGTNTGCIVVGADGSMYIGGVSVGLLDPKNYKVLRYDKSIYEEYARQQRAKMRRETNVPIPKSVAKTATVNANYEPIGVDEFFARIALEIAETLKGEADLSFEYGIEAVG